VKSDSRPKPAAQFWLAERQQWPTISHSTFALNVSSNQIPAIGTPGQLMAGLGRLLPVNPHKTNHCQWPLCNNFRLLV